ncbi:MAG: translation initiation factor IF-2 [Rhodobacteraceae bacterium]|nr:translation initiation factor IF-2 [Paracoccaceae bacterium]
MPKPPLGRKSVNEVVVGKPQQYGKLSPLKPIVKPARPAPHPVDPGQQAPDADRQAEKIRALKAFSQQEQERRLAEDRRRRLEQQIAEQAVEQKPEAQPDTVAETRPPTTPAAKPAPQPARPASHKRQERKRRDGAGEQRPGGRVQQERRSSSKINVARALNEDEVHQRSHAALRRSQERKRRQAMSAETVREKIRRDVQIPETIIVQELANRMAERVTDVIKVLMQNGVRVTQNQAIDADTAELIVSEFGHRVIRVSAADVEDVIESKEDEAEDLQPRSPVISVMGHVDHGKTSLLDAIRNTQVAAGEAGGITQHIGAYRVLLENERRLTFLDTPGHAAFTAMRARGAQVTDIVVLVVAADDAVMPQTVEAINHAKAAEVPMIIAINKCDLPGAVPDKVRTDLLRHDVIVEKHSGFVLDVEVSAQTGQGLDQLLEAIALQAELLELRANPDRAAEGAIIESKLDVGRGTVATVLVQRGTLRKGDVLVAGEQWGKVRALIDDTGAQVESAGPSVPVEVLGLNGTPLAGDILNVVSTESQAREISKYRKSLSKERRVAAGTVMSLDQMMKLHEGEESKRVSTLQLVVKADVQGSVEAIVQAVEKIGNEEVKVRVLHSGVGAITETDISLAEASDARVLGFNVRANAPARAAANQRGIDVSYYSVIYALVDEIRAAASNLLAAEIKEHIIGSAEILEVFKITGAGFVAGCRVTDGAVRKTAAVRLLRDDTVIHEGRLKTLKRFKDDVNEVQSGQECGMAFENYANIRKGDHIEVFERQEIERSL